MGTMIPYYDCYSDDRKQIMVNICHASIHVTNVRVIYKTCKTCNYPTLKDEKCNYLKKRRNI